MNAFLRRERTEKAAERAHRAWAKKMTLTVMNRPATEQELRSLGRVPYFAAFRAGIRYGRRSGI